MVTDDLIDMIATKSSDSLTIPDGAAGSLPNFLTFKGFLWIGDMTL